MFSWSLCYAFIQRSDAGGERHYKKESVLKYAAEPEEMKRCSISPSGSAVSGP